MRSPIDLLDTDTLFDSTASLGYTVRRELQPISARSSSSLDSAIDPTRLLFITNILFFKGVPSAVVMYEWSTIIMPTANKLVAQVPLKFPKIGNPPVYEGFLKSFLRTSSNHKAFVVAEKETFDAEYERQLRQQYKHDDTSYRRYMGEVDVQFLRCRLRPNVN